MLPTQLKARCQEMRKNEDVEHSISGMLCTKPPLLQYHVPVLKSSDALFELAPALKREVRTPEAQGHDKVSAMMSSARTMVYPVGPLSLHLDLSSIKIHWALFPGTLGSIQSEEGLRTGHCSSFDFTETLEFHCVPQ